MSNMFAQDNAVPRPEDIQLNFVRNVEEAIRNALTYEEAFQNALDLICREMEWDVGHVYFLEETSGDDHLLVPSDIWYLGHPSDYKIFYDLTRKTTFSSGEGLPGRVLESKNYAWIENLATDTNFPRNKLSHDLPVQTGFALPILLNNKIFAVMEFFSAKTISEDPIQLNSLFFISDYLEGFIERKKFTEEIIIKHQEQNLRLFGLDIRNLNIAKKISIVAGVLSTLLGAIVLFGWHTKQGSLIQIAPTFVPMQYNTALGFLLCGLGMVACTRGLKRIMIICGAVPLLIGAMTLLEYIANLNLGIDQLLMEHYITVETSHPGRMAPNTALCFVLTGTALILIGGGRHTQIRSWSAGILGSLILALGVAALTGYLTQFESAYGWGNLTRMAIHTAVGFSILGTGMMAFAGYCDTYIKYQEKQSWRWSHVAVGLTITTFMVCLAQAMNAHESELVNQFGDKMHNMNDSIVIISGVILGMLFSTSFWFSEKARLRATTAEAALMQIDKKVKERQKLQKSVKKSESTLRDHGQYLTSIVDSVADAIVTIGKHGTIKSVNKAFENIFQYKASEVINKNVTIIIPEQTQRKHSESLKTYLDTGEARFVGRGPREVVGIKKDGSEVIVNVSVEHLNLAGENSFVGVIRDITDHKAMQEKLEQAQRLEAIGQMTGGIAHDFNNILTVVRGNLELLEELFCNEAEREDLLKKAQKGVQRGADLTDRLLAFSRKQVLRPSITDVNGLVEDFLVIIQKSLSDNIKLKTNLSTDLWKPFVDEAQLENAILNLIINASDAMPEGGSIMLETSNITLSDDDSYINELADAPVGDFIVIAVSDTGTGIPQEILKQIFDPFFTTKDIGQGTGLGLSMVYGFSVQSGGTTKVYSEEGVGTTVKIFIPYDKYAHDDEPASSTQKKSYSLVRGTENILVVEDDEDLLDYCVASLESLGYNVQSALNAAQALDIVQKNKDFELSLDLLLTDVVMPGGKNGEELAAEVRETTPDIKVIYMSGFTRDALVEQGKLKSGVTLIQKPFSRGHVAETIRRILEE